MTAISPGSRSATGVLGHLDAGIHEDLPDALAVHLGGLVIRILREGRLERLPDFATAVVGDRAAMTGEVLEKIAVIRAAMGQSILELLTG